MSILHELKQVMREAKRKYLEARTDEELDTLLEERMPVASIDCWPVIDGISYDDVLQEQLDRDIQRCTRKDCGCF